MATRFRYSFERLSVASSIYRPERILLHPHLFQIDFPQCFGLLLSLSLELLLFDELLFEWLGLFE